MPPNYYAAWNGVGCDVWRFSMGKKSKKENSESGGGYFSTVAVSLVLLLFAVVGGFLFSQQQQPSSPSPIASKTKPSVSSPNPLNEIPTYDEYIALSQKNNWRPHDPILKLLETSKRYSQSIDVTNRTRTMELIQFSNQELQFLLSVN
jgi:cytoskeletal protein RodZ